MAYQGKAGEWVVAFHPLRAGVRRATGQWNASLSVAGEGVHLYAGPDFVGVGESGLDALQNVRAGHGRLGLAWSWNGYREIADGIAGLLFVFGAEDDWAVHYRFELDDADLFPPTVAQGTGFVGKVGAHAGGVAGARQLALEATFAEPGWNHVGAITYALQPVGLREMSVTFADGTSWNSTGYSAGAWTPVSENQVTSHFQDQHGHPQDTAGRVRATATTLEAAVETDIAIAHFPFNDGIAGLTLAPYHAHGGQQRIDPT